ncbi:hypothetical protein L3081_15725 [Colwellia sp. MSW7]|uniref:Swiss Army Knife 2H phosphoesterase domain-containing protein n=1 Tax=Colwellia maritima TaxID=2912588 RepID=A0ABS9X549_9GAMM|nr:hypothetical protein [Colwellia maritima]MCI2284576.1 hypothetical protein [Colwellia maritima]
MYKFCIVVFLICMQTRAIAEPNSAGKAELISQRAQARQASNDVEAQQIRRISKTLRLKITKLSDNRGQEYIGATVSRAELQPYLAKLESILGASFQQYRERQATRDHQLFHMTIISPPEYQVANKTDIEKLLSLDVINSSMSGEVNVTLLGLGNVQLDNKETYFIVAKSSDAQMIRQQFLLKNKDFHITLGFNPDDIYGVTKDSSTLIKE